MKGMSTSQIIINDSDSASDYERVGLKKRVQGKGIGQKGSSAKDKSANDDVSVTNQFRIKKIERNPEQLRLQTHKTITDERGEFVVAVASTPDQMNKASVVANQGGGGGQDMAADFQGRNYNSLSKSLTGEQNLSAK